MTNTAEIMAVCDAIKGDVPRPAQKPLSGASPTLQEALGDDAQLEVVQYPGSAAVGIRIVPNDGNDSGELDRSEE